ncbi:Hybrid signal transduction histidine kinase K [Sphaceloma murrayae]|uniref:histidine kinase n=1 Tax=Sphaceloma murrayae TaxID=2082308 RepID=A0A2K1QJT2_9PEZI|nr:Hybrid signal transduction histidine kinase K [Sphaceloma murrayae]
MSDHDLRSSSGVAPDLVELGLVEYVAHDPRPTFIIDLHGCSVARDGCGLAYGNDAFRSSPVVSQVSGSVTTPFTSWVLSPSVGTVEFENLVWSSATLRERWRVVSGVASPGRVSRLTTNDDPATKDTRSFTSTRTSVEVCKGSNICFWPGQSVPHHGLIENYDWGNTALGPIGSWSSSLVALVQLMLSTPSPASLIWGVERIMIYNEAFCPLIGSWHPQMIGQSLRVAWQDFWPDHEAICAEVETTKQAVRVIAADGPLFERDGILSETFLTFDHIPIFSEAGDVVAVYDQVVDVTQDVFAKGRMATLQRMSDIATTATGQGVLWDATLKTLQDATKDVPLAAIFSIKNDVSYSEIAAQAGDQEPAADWVFKGCVGFRDTHASYWDLARPDGLAEAIRIASGHTGTSVFRIADGVIPPSVVADLDYKGYSYTTILICPLRLSSGAAVGCLIIGANPLRPYDNEYQHFVQVMARQIEDALKLVVIIEAQSRLLRDTVKQATIQQQVLSEQLIQQTKEARESELRFLNFAEQAPVGVYVLDNGGNVQYCNDTWRKLVGYPGDIQSMQKENQIWRVNVHPDDKEEVDRQWQLLVDGNTQEMFEWRVVLDSHDELGEVEVVYLRSSCFPELAEDGTMKTVTGILTDRSLEVAHQRIIHAKMEAVLEEKRAQEYFMDMVSHEMRNPLHAMILCAEEAMEMLMDFKRSLHLDQSRNSALDECLAATTTILYCGRHQKEIIDDVLTLSKLDSNLLTISPVPISPETVIHQALNMFQANMRAADITLETKFESTDLLHRHKETVLMDPGRTLQVLINLIGNALKFMKDQPVRHLHVSLSASRELKRDPSIKYLPSGRIREDPTIKSSEWGNNEEIYIYFGIRDTGPGIGGPEMNALFARFNQASPRTHAQYGGSGLGLFISRELTELHGGEIGVASEVGKGSTFAFYVKGRRITQSPTAAGSTSTEAKRRPEDELATREAISGSRPKTDVSQPPLDKLGVLIVEDNIINQRVLERQLRKLGCKVTTANHGAEALDMLTASTWWCGSPSQETTTAQERFSIILCDLEMPVMDGKTCVRTIREWQAAGKLMSNIPVLAVTGNARVPLHEAQEWGFDNVVSKPFSVKSLVPQIANLIKPQEPA